MRFHHYLERNTGLAVSIHSYKRPSATTIPKRGTWVIREWRDGEFRVAGEITLGTIQNKLFYLGSTKL